MTRNLDSSLKLNKKEATILFSSSQYFRLVPQTNIDRVLCFSIVPPFFFFQPPKKKFFFFNLHSVCVWRAWTLDFLPSYQQKQRRKENTTSDRIFFSSSSAFVGPALPRVDGKCVCVFVPFGFRCCRKQMDTTRLWHFSAIPPPTDHCEHRHSVLGGIMFCCVVLTHTCY